MSLPRFLFVALALGYLSRFGFADDPSPTLERAPDKAVLQERIDAATKQIKQFPNQQGQIIIGQVEVEGKDNPETVFAQMQILKGGFFAGPTRNRSSPIGFRLHQYAPYDLELDDTDAEIVDVGIIKMKRLPPEELVPLKGKLVLEGSENPHQATISLTVSGGPVNTPTNGTEPRQTWPEPIKVRIDAASGTFQANSFSPIIYHCEMSAPGYVSQSFPIEMEPRVGADLGTITLEKPRRVALEYIVATEGDFDLSEMKKVTLSGGARWKATRDIYGWDLEFTQLRGKLYFKYAYGPCYLENLGEGELKDFLDAGDVIVKEFPKETAVEDGHVYLVNQVSWKRRILIKATLKQPE